MSGVGGVVKGNPPGMVSLCERSPREEETDCPEKPISREMALHFYRRRSRKVIVSPIGEPGSQAVRGEDSLKF